ncbi:MAG: porin family protein [Bradyrhizobium sp.]|nr:porin family protein [Bradyrhizobium sp.]
MKKLSVAVLGLAVLGFASSASAADMAARPYKAPPPVVAPIYNWTGFYIGANGGWGSSHSCWDFVTLGAAVRDGCRDATGGLVGGQIGYRWQAGQWVFGLEGQGDWADLSASRVSFLNPAFSTRTRVNGIGLFTGQIGYAWDAALFYVKGGGAVTGNNYSILTTLGGLNVASADATRWGGAIGVGFEYGFAPNWSVGVEYDHLFMGNANNSFSVVNPIVAGALNRVNQDVDMVTLRLNWRFGGPYGAPVTARY